MTTPLLKYTKNTDYFDNLQKVYPISEVEVNTPISKTDQAQIKHILTFTPATPELFDQFVDLVKANNWTIQATSMERFIFNQTPDLISDKTKLKLLNNQRKLFSDQGPAIYYDRLVKNNRNSRAMAPSFKNYVEKLPGFVTLEDFAKANAGITTASDVALRNFVKENFNIDTHKGVDGLLKNKSGHVYIIEAKFVSAAGGAQNHQIKDALRRADIETANVSGLAVIDGFFFEDIDNYALLRNYAHKDRIVSATELEKVIENG